MILILYRLEGDQSTEVVPFADPLEADLEYENLQRDFDGELVWLERKEVQIP